MEGMEGLGYLAVFMIITGLAGLGVVKAFENSKPKKKNTFPYDNQDYMPKNITLD